MLCCKNSWIEVSLVVYPSSFTKIFYRNTSSILTDVNNDRPEITFKLALLLLQGESGERRESWGYCNTD